MCNWCVSLDIAYILALTKWHNQTVSFMLINYSNKDVWNKRICLKTLYDYEWQIQIRIQTIPPDVAPCWFLII